MTQDINPNKTHVLHFFYDDVDDCALTVLVNNVRFHIMVDLSDLQGSPRYREYLDRLSALQDAERREEERTEEAEARASLGKRTRERMSNDKDSAIDMTADEEVEEDKDKDSRSAGVELRNWILSAFADVTAESAPPDREPEESTLHEWYHGPTYFYSMRVEDGELTPVLLETTSDLNMRIEELVPCMRIPKYIQKIDIPWVSAHELTVQSEVSFPEPAHPGKVTHSTTRETYFFKPVDATQPGPIKREIQILQKLEKLDLDIKVPILRGFVAFKEKSKREIMGLLLSHIEDPTPLTKLLDSSISLDKRSIWSQKSAEYIQRLHEHKIIWGDAKADNFLVDAKDELWIIDFGGSYTEGWVDPELSETKEGDEQGLKKIQRALEDPDANTFDLGKDGAGKDKVRETASSLFVTERKEEEEEEEEEEGSGEKRKRKLDDEEEEKQGKESKRAK